MKRQDPPAQPTTEFYGLLQRAYDHFNEALFERSLPPVILTVQRERNTCGFFSPQRWARNPSREQVHELAVNPSYFGTGPIREVLQTLVHEQAHIWQFEHGTPPRKSYHDREWAEKMEAIGLMPSHTGRPGGRRTGQKMSDYPIPGGRFEAAALDLVRSGWLLAWVDRFTVKPRSDLALAAGEALAALAGFGTDRVEEGTAPGPAEEAAVAPIEENAPTRRDEATIKAQAVLSTPLMTILPDVMVNTPEREKERKAKQKVKYTCGCGVNVWGKPGLSLICGSCEDWFEASAEAG